MVKSNNETEFFHNSLLFPLFNIMQKCFESFDISLLTQIFDVYRTLLLPQHILNYTRVYPLFTLRNIG